MLPSDAPHPSPLLTLPAELSSPRRRGERGSTMASYLLYLLITSRDPLESAKLRELDQLWTC